MQKIHKFLQCLFLILSLILLAFILYKIINHTFCDCNDLIFLFAVLITMSLLGSIPSKFLFNSSKLNYLSEKTDEYFNDNIVQLIQNYKDFATIEELENQKIEQETNDEINLVIVPAGITIEKIKKDKIYVQKLNRPFKKNINYIAFYVRKKIVGYSEVIDIEVINGILNYKLKSFETLNILHEAPGFFVLNRKYSNLSLIRKAKTTSDL